MILSPLHCQAINSNSTDCILSFCWEFLAIYNLQSDICLRWSPRKSQEKVLWYLQVYLCRVTCQIAWGWLLKGLIMDRCVLLTSTPEWVVLLHRGLCPRDRPAAWQPTRELRSTTHTYPWLIPIITWCWHFHLSTNILLIKSKLKLESRAIVVGVAMSPRDVGGKYRCRLHPRWRKCTRQFFPGTRVCQSNCIRVASSLAWR